MTGSVAGGGVGRADLADDGDVGGADGAQDIDISGALAVDVHDDGVVSPASAALAQHVWAQPLNGLEHIRDLYGGQLLTGDDVPGRAGGPVDRRSAGAGQRGEGEEGNQSSKHVSSFRI